MNSGQVLFRDFLARKLLELKNKNPKYSLRALARDLDQNSAALSQMLSGSRKVSRSFALKMSERMGCSPTELERLARAFDVDTLARTGATSQKSDLSLGRKQLDLKHYDIVADWAYYAVISLAETVDFQSDKEWIAARLGISTVKAQVILDALMECGHLARLSDGSIKHCGKAVAASDGIANMALRRRHETNLDDARSSLFRDELMDRDFTFMTVAVDPDQLPIAKKMIRQFHNTLSDLFDSGERTEVYEVCVQLFPRSRLRPSATDNNEIDSSYINELKNKENSNDL